MQAGRAVAIARAAEIGIVLFLSQLMPLPWSVLLLVVLLGATLLFGVRAIRRLARAAQVRRGRMPYSAIRRALFVGAVEAGSVVVRELHRHAEADIQPTGFLDDDLRKRSMTLEGCLC